MNEISSAIAYSDQISNLSTLEDASEWWNDDPSPLRLDGDEGGLFTGIFVPPPPRPLFLDDGATPDGLTTCDLCSWAWQDAKTFTLDTTLEAPGEFGWVLTLVIVSLISAIVGAIVMIVVLHCKRIKNTENNIVTDLDLHTNSHNRNRPPISIPDDKSLATARLPEDGEHRIANTGVWSWLSRRSSTNSTQLTSPTSPAENHYTHMEEHYDGVVGEALYAELDRDESNELHPAYQNSAYTDPDAPSSAYYSDLSITTVPERAYEVVGLSTLTWEEVKRNPQAGNKLASISETVPSDYV